jgi:molecular chaperone IbpA
MSTYDTNLLWRSTIGFDRLFDLIDSSMTMAEDNYPPYNIERGGEDSYSIELAVAGFAPDEISVVAEQNMLTVQGRKADKGDHNYLHQGISSRPFRRQFRLADFVQVKGASFKDGLLQIDLVREVPEAMKPRRIPIESSKAAESKQIEHQQAA